MKRRQHKQRNELFKAIGSHWAKKMPQLIAVAETAYSNESVLQNIRVGQLRYVLCFLFDSHTAVDLSIKK